MDKDTKKLVKAIKAQGFTVTPTRRRHLRVVKDGHQVAVLAGTASDYRSWRNAIADLRRAGFQWPPKR
ncbi:hypothetical protein [Kineococcus rhizosphaerae]|uniref:HicA-like toxin of HicAB toxin-antitoxin system n=1 Tax=Kineococcus rhizosphaerae TaxID=559628 RepID=A0A2T0QPY9_9ACTN|nr:hypothetical protein [Kineococcus rhizosphaerae]PRY06789.1 hypothetical protein CLV37_1323 [Kineococcus rhizosphaerae]